MELSFLLKVGGFACMSWSGYESDSVDEDGLFWTSVCSAMIRGSGVVLHVEVPVSVI